MEQLGPLDSMFVFGEQPRLPGHVGGFAIYDPSTAEGGMVRFKDIIQRTVEAGKMVPYMRRRLVRVPFDLDFPYWVNDESFDPEYHVRHLALPKPGDWRQLCIMVARLYARSLDMKRPLWETYVIEGLDNVPGLPPGCFAVLSKIHHACVDGQSAVDIGMATSDLSPQMKVLKDPGDWKADRVPTDAELLYRTGLNNMSKPFRQWETMMQQAPTLQKFMGSLQRGEVTAPPSEAPRTRFSGAVSGHHVFDSALFPLATIRAIKNKAGTTVNDVAVAIVSGAMRAYLLEKGELPEESLVTQCPINVRTEESGGGNNVSAMLIPLCSHIKDPAQRLAEVKKSTRSGKDYASAIGAKTMMEQSQFMPTALFAAGSRTAAEQQMANTAKPLQNTVTTNVPGSPVPTFAYGATLLYSFGMGMVLDGLGPFHSIGSNVDQFSITVTACRDQLPDPANYAQKLRDSFDELVMAILGDKKLCIGKQDHPIPPSLAMTTPTVERLDEVLAITAKYMAEHGEVRAGSTGLKAKKPAAAGGAASEPAPASRPAPKKKTAANKAVVKKAAAKRAVTKKAVTKKAVPKKAVPKRAAVKNN